MCEHDFEKSFQLCQIYHISQPRMTRKFSMYFPEALYFPACLDVTKNNCFVFKLNALAGHHRNRDIQSEPFSLIACQPNSYQNTLNSYNFYSSGSFYNAVF